MNIISTVFTFRVECSVHNVKLVKISAITTLFFLPPYGKYVIHLTCISIVQCLKILLYTDLTKYVRNTCNLEEPYHVYYFITVTE